jgi:hypothetical protein
MVVGVEGGVPPLPKSILLIGGGVQVKAAAGGPVRAAGGSVAPRPAMREERLGVKIGTSLAPRLLLCGVGLAEHPGVRMSTSLAPRRLLDGVG